MNSIARIAWMLVLSAIIVSTPVQATKLGTKDLLKWTCPGPPQDGPERDADSSRTYLHVVDAAGNDFKVRCINGYTGWYYEYYVSFPNGSEETLSRCIYSLGFNDLQLIYSGTLTETENAKGTPVLTVGSLDIVEHSNIEGTGLAFNMRVKPGGRDFHVVHDYRQGRRYRINTIGGRGTSTDLLARNVTETGTSITRAGMVALASPAAYAPELAVDTEFRALDDPEAVAPCEDCLQAPTVDDPAKQLGFERIKGANGSSLLFRDPELRDSSFEYEDASLLIDAPARPGREVATLAFHPHLLLAAEPEELTIDIDGHDVKADWLAHSGMMRVAMAVDAGPHVIRISLRNAGNSGPFARYGALLLLAVILVLALLVAVARQRLGRADK